MEKKKGFEKHESSDSHMKAVARYVKAPATEIGDIDDLRSERHALQKSKSRKILLSISFAIIIHRIEYLVVCLGQAV